MFLYCKVKFFEWLEQRKVEKQFYHCGRYKQCDQALLNAYVSETPYQISKEFLTRKQARNVYAYGETPLTTMASIAWQCGLSADDVVIEMGAGRGRSSLFLAEYVGCQVIAYEQIEAFVNRAPCSSRLDFLVENMFSADFSKATAIYLYGTMLADEEISRLAEAFPKNVKILTVSYPLSDYHARYEIKKSFTGRFPWGKTEVYWNERIS